MALLLHSYVHGSVTGVSTSTFRPICQVDSKSCARDGLPASCSTKKKKDLAHLTSTGFWEVDSQYAYYLDRRLADALVRFLDEAVENSTSTSAAVDTRSTSATGAAVRTTSDVMELGAGMGCYTQHLASRGVSIRAYDGSPTVAQRTDGLVHTADLSRRQSLGHRADWVFCTEVAEHIPPEFEEALLYNLHEHNRKGVVLSWSNLKPPHGNGHVTNPNPNPNPNPDPNPNPNSNPNPYPNANPSTPALALTLTLTRQWPRQPPHGAVGDCALRGARVHGRRRSEPEAAQRGAVPMVQVQPLRHAAERVPYYA